MDQLSLSWIDPDYNPDNSPEHQLYMLAGIDGFSYLIRDDQGKVLVLKSWDFSTVAGDILGAQSLLRTISSTEKHLKLAFKDRVGAISTPWLTLVPQRLFDEQQLSSYFGLLLEPGDYHPEVFFQPDHGLAWAYAQPTGMHRTIRAIYETDRVLPIAAVLKENLGVGQDYWVYANIRSYQIQLFVANRGTIQYCNTFDFESPGDLLYYVLLAYEQFRIDPSQVPLHLSGNILSSGDLYRHLYRYIETIQFAKTPAPLRWSSSLRLEAPHLYYDLFCLAANANQLLT